LITLFYYTSFLAHTFLIQIISVYFSVFANGLKIDDFRFQIEKPVAQAFNLKSAISNLKSALLLLIRDHALYFALVAIAHERWRSQIPFSLLALRRQNVTQVRTAPLDFPRPG